VTGVQTCALPILKMFAGDVMPAALDVLSMDPSAYFSAAVSLIVVRLGMKNG